MTMLNFKTIKIFGIVLCFLQIFFAGCGKWIDKSEEQKVIYEVEDDRGVTIRFTSKPQKILATTSSMQEILLDLVAPERVVAVFEENKKPDSLVYEKAMQIDKTLSTTLSVEMIVALQPDLLFVQETMDKTLVATLEDMGIRVYYLKVATRFTDIEKRLEQMGKAVGDTEKGIELLNEFKAKEKSLVEFVAKIPTTERKTVIAYSVDGAFGSEAGLFHEICVQAGVNNGAALAGLVRGSHLSKEQIVKVRPDYFIFPISNDRMNAEITKIEKQVMEDPAFAEIPAAKQENLIFINDRYRYAGSQYAVDASILIARKVYQEYF